MPLRKLFLVPLAALGAALAVGCSSPNSQLTRIQEDKEQLLATVREQRDKNRQLLGQVTSLESRLDQSEKELAQIGGGTRLSSKPTSSNTSQSLPPARAQLPWRAPAGKAGISGPPANGPAASGPRTADQRR